MDKDKAPDRIPASSSSTIGVDRRRRSPSSSSSSRIDSRQSAHLPRLALNVLVLALTLGLFGGAAHAQTSPTCVRSDIAVIGAVGSRTLSNAKRDMLAADCTALLAFKAALTLGSGDNTSLNWARNRGMHQWQSIGMNGERSRVTRLTLGPGYNITGTLPDLSALDALTYLRLSYNNLTPGPIPAWVGTLTNLRHLDLQRNRFNGAIPASFSNLTNLTYLRLNRNNLTGGLPWWSALTSLEELHLNNNFLTGCIPSLSGLTALTHVNLHTNELTGQFPNPSGLANLEELDFSRNALTGPIGAITGTPKLKRLALGRNKLTGEIPALNHLTELNYVELNDNNLTGEIPALSGLTNLHTLNVGNNFRFTRGVANNLTGEIPALSTLGNLVQLIVSDNQLTGAIPALPTGNNLQEISAHLNRLTGGIPSLPSTGMRVLNLRDNRMTGNINNVTAATNLRRLFLGRNSFSGAIPANLGNLTSLQHLSLCRTSLSGGLPTATNTRRTDGDLTMWQCLHINSPSVNEGGRFEFDVNYSRKPLSSGNTPGVVTIEFQDGTATTAEDYTPLTGTNLRSNMPIASGNQASLWPMEYVNTKTDCLVEGPETFTIAFSSIPSGALWSYGGTGTINDVAPAPGCPPTPTPDPDPPPDPEPAPSCLPPPGPGPDPGPDPDPDPEPDPDPGPEPEPLDPDRFVAPYWRGTGGIVVKPANGLSVKFRMSCRGARTTETLYANDDGLIVQLVRRDPCTDDDGNPVRSEVSIRDIVPGGWYWIDGPRNAAVAPLVSEVDLGGAVATIPAGVETDVTDNGTFFEHEVARLIGIVPHLPKPDDGVCSEYVKPYWRGAGGIVVKPTDGESVEWRTTCSGETTTQTLQANDDGLVVQLLREDSDSCTDAAGNPIASEVSVQGARPGGWYWVDGPRNAAVAPLVCRDLLVGPAATVPVGVDTDAADDGTLFEHQVARLIGIVPHLRRPPEE